MLLRFESLPAAKKGLQPRDGMCRHKNSRYTGG